MADVLQTLEEHIDRMLEGMRRLSDDNLALRAEIDAERLARQKLESRFDEARVRVESALGRLPTASGDTPPGTPPSTPLSKAD